jgi:ribosomal protein S18 acetylase RimI-like enzyme
MANVTRASKLSVRKASPEDIPLIRDLTYKVWPQTYATILTNEQINYMLEFLYSESSLKKQMKDHHRFLIVYDEIIPAGFASYSEIDHGIFKLHKIYVLPDQQGKGTGRFLLDYIIKDILRQGAKTLQLNVNRHNKAKNFYEKLGFTLIKEEDVDIGNGYFMNDYIMEKKLG